MSSAISRPSSSAQRPAEEAGLLGGAPALSHEASTKSGQPASQEQPHRGKLASINCTVAGVVILHLYIFLTVVFCVIVPWLSWSVPGLLNLGVFSANTSTALLCFLACVVVDPGRVPPEFQPDLEAQPVMQVKRKSGEARFCQKCDRHKPPRAHHCRVCKHCVLRMDHHCPWINNCVGHGNYKAFLLFLIYANAAVLHALGLLCAHALHYLAMLAENRQHAIRTVGPKGVLSGSLMEAEGTRGTMLWAVLQTVCLALTLPLAIGLAMLLGWNLYLALTNKTTIEFYEGVTASIQAGRAGAAAYQHPYDLGLCGNLHALCGHSPTTWLVPTLAAAHGDGLAYPTTYDRAHDDIFGL